MLELFRMEAETHTATLSAGLLALEGATAPPHVIEPLMRAAHSLKGAARIVGLDSAVKVAHAMEDSFVAAQKGTLPLTTRHVDVLLRGVDFLVGVAQLAESDLESWQNEHASEVEGLVADLTDLLHPEAAPRVEVGLPLTREPVASSPEAAAAIALDTALEIDPEPPTTLSFTKPQVAPPALPADAPAPASSTESSERDRVVRVTAQRDAASARRTVFGGFHVQP
jgi:two-component system sensor histidine kinase and response regulator WspE